MAREKITEYTGFVLEIRKPNSLPDYIHAIYFSEAAKLIQRKRNQDGALVERLFGKTVGPGKIDQLSEDLLDLTEILMHNKEPSDKIIKEAESRGFIYLGNNKEALLKQIG